MSFDITASVYADHDRDMNLDEGTTCATLRDILYGAGLDTHASVIRVFRNRKIYIGRMDDFVLQEGDHVEFRTSYDLVVEHDVKEKKVSNVHEFKQEDRIYPPDYVQREHLRKLLNSLIDSLHLG